MKNFGEYSAEVAMDFIEAWEGCRLQAYKCPAGIWTIGVGHTGPDVHEGDEITYAQSRELLRKDIEAVVKALAPFVNVHVTEGQYVALVSLAFNVGAAQLPEAHEGPQCRRRRAGRASVPRHHEGGRQGASGARPPPQVRSEAFPWGGLRWSTCVGFFRCL